MDWIYNGILKNKDKHFKVRKLETEDLETILDVQKQVVAALHNQATLQPLTSEEFRYILEGNGLMIGAFVEETLIAFRALLIPVMDEEHLGRDIGLEDEELPKVIYQEISNVLPDYRGNQLQKILASVIMEELGRSQLPFRYVCCTVAPFNIPSLKDKFAQDMQIAALKEKYGGQLRYIFVKDLENGETSDRKETTFILMSDIESQQEKLGEGWRGIRMEEKDGDILVKYVR
nr:GNAT family N-acetyltransferase [Neobacillus sp. Marseille-Q6967]